MRWRRLPKPERAPGEYPESFVKRFMAGTLPSATPAEAASAVRHLRSQGWTEEQLAEFLLPYMPRDVPPRATPSAPAEPAPSVLRADDARVLSVPSHVTSAWLDEHLPALEHRQLRHVVDELELRGWPSGTVAMAVLPHLLPKLPPEDARAVVSGLADLGMTDEEIARATTPRSARRGG